MSVGARVALISAACAGGAILSAGSPLAVPSSTAATVDRPVAEEFDRLGELRERLTRRAALHRLVSRQVSDLALEVEDLLLRREEAEAALNEAREETRRLDRRLDRLVPRLLVRSAAVRERRDQAGRALAELAVLSRQVQLDPTLRARMLAISPVLLARLRGAEASIASLEEERERATRRHRELENQKPLLLAELRQLQGQREQKKQQYDVLLARLERLDTELADLERAERSLAAAALRTEHAHAARAEPQADQPALDVPTAWSAPPDATSDASIKGLAMRGDYAAPSTHAVQPSVAQVVAIAPGGAGALAKPSLLGEAMFDVLPPPAKPFQVAIKGDLAAALPAASHNATSFAGPVDVAYREPFGAPEAEGEPPMARLPGSAVAPLIPAPGQPVGQFSRDSYRPDDPAITIVAGPGQPVAAPDDGRVVFAHPFKSYGLLLIIEHDSEYHTLLWGFSRLDVETGDRVRTGQIVGVMGEVGDEPPKLHVELRRHGRPVNPLPWLAASSSKVRG